MPKVHTRREFTRSDLPEWAWFARRLDPDGRYPVGVDPPPGWCAVELLPGSLAAAAALPLALRAEQGEGPWGIVAAVVWVAVAPLWLAPVIDRVTVTRDLARETLNRLGPLGAPARGALGAAYAVGGRAAYAAALVTMPVPPNDQPDLPLYPFLGP